MFGRQVRSLLLTGLLVVALALVACQSQTVENVKEVVVTRVVTETVVEEGESVEVTRIVTETETVTEEVIVEVTAVPEAAALRVDPHPAAYAGMQFGDIDTLDPNLSYDTASSEVIDNVMETLIWYNHKDGTTFVPALAMDVPSIENGLISEDGLTYTFNIREGVTFHEGGALEPHDVAYTFQRGLLQSDPNGPQWLLIEPFLGAGFFDITELIDPEGSMYGDPEALAAADPAAVQSVCEQVQNAIVADDAAGTVTMNLAQPWGPFIATLAGTWGAVIDMEWAIEQGAWDGTCETWVDHYAPGSENSPLTAVINGTGPYMLDYWTPGEEWALVRNDNYWRTEDTPLWEGGPYGPAAIEHIIIQLADEWGTRYAALQAGDVDWANVPGTNESQVDPLVAEVCDPVTDECTPTGNEDGLFRKWDNLASVERTDVFLNFEVASDSPYIGSGALDGEGIPVDFFNDINVRKAMNHCFDYDAFIAEVQNGKGIRNNGPIIKDMLGYNEDGEYYQYDPELCAHYFAEAHGGVLPETGFRFQIAFNTGNTTRQSVGAIFQSELGTVNPRYQVEIVGIPWPTFLRSFRSGQLPVAVSGWIEDIHDPHNWAQPFTVGTYAGRQNMPEELLAQFNDLVDAGVSSADPAEREQIYFELQKLHHDEAPQVTLSQRTGFRIEQPWVEGYYYRVGQFAPNYYALGWTGD